jgi:osmotically inducible protein OsmC
MGIVKQTASVVWQGSIARGRGQINGGSGAIAEVPVTLASRLGNVEGLTSPEELIAAAHAACFTTTLGSILARQRTPPERLTVDAVCSLDDTEGQRRILAIDLEVHGRVPGAEPDRFQQAAAEAEQNCVVTKALRGNVEIRAHATLEQAP